MSLALFRPALKRPARYRGLLLISLLLPTSSLLAEQEISARLEAMAEAMRSLNYEGELIYRHGDAVDVLKMVHTVRNGEERERLTSLNGVPREVVRDENAVVCILPESKAVSFDQRTGGHAFPRLLPMVADELLALYDIRLGGDGRVAGHHAQVIDILPKDNFRYARRLYLDQEHHLPLRLDMLDGRSKVVASVMYSRLRVDENMPFEASQPTIHSDGYALVRRQEMRNPREQSPFKWQFGPLPKGYQVQQHEVRHDEVSDEWREHVVLSDGLAMVSVYIEKDDPKEHLEGSSSMGAVSLFGHRNKAGHVTVVGEVPPRTVRAIAEAVDFSR